MYFHPYFDIINTFHELGQLQFSLISGSFPTVPPWVGSWDIQVGQQRKKHGQNCVSIGYIDDKKPKIF